MFPGDTGPSADPAGSHHERRIRSFQPRRSRVTSGQRAALSRLWPRWGFEIDGLRRLDLDEMFADTAPLAEAAPFTETATESLPDRVRPSRPVVLEIGFG